MAGIGALSATATTRMTRRRSATITSLYCSKTVKETSGLVFISRSRITFQLDPCRSKTLVVSRNRKSASFPVWSAAYTKTGGPKSGWVSTGVYIASIARVGKFGDSKVSMIRTSFRLFRTDQMCSGSATHTPVCSDITSKQENEEAIATIALIQQRYAAASSIVSLSTMKERYGRPRGMVCVDLAHRLTVSRNIHPLKVAVLTTSPLRKHLTAACGGAVILVFIVLTRRARPSLSTVMIPRFRPASAMIT